LEEVPVETPMAVAQGKVLSGKKIGIVPILRAGLGMVSGMTRLIPNAKVGHLGMYRDHDTLKPVEYYWKLPADVAERDIIVVDPMLATGGSAVAACDFLKSKGVRRLKFMCLIAAPEGVRALSEKHPDVPIYTAAVDSHLDAHGYIIPGLGDAGDRLFGTE
jgi:uracil phosphoribosyltransferase